MFALRFFNRLHLQRLGKIESQLILSQVHKYASCLSGIKLQKVSHVDNPKSLSTIDASTASLEAENLQSLISSLHSAIFSVKKLNYYLIAEIIKKIAMSKEELTSVNQAMLIFKCLCSIKNHPPCWQIVLEKVYDTLVQKTDELSMNQIIDISLWLRDVSIERQMDYYSPVLLDALTTKIIKDNMNLSCSSTLLVTMKMFDHCDLYLFEHVCDRFLFRASSKMLSQQRIIGFFLLIVGTMDKMNHVPKRWTEIVKFVDLSRTVDHINDTALLTVLLQEVTKYQSEHQGTIKKLIARLQLFQDEFKIFEAIRTFKVLYALEIRPEGWKNLLQMIYNVIMNDRREIPTADLDFIISVITADKDREKEFYSEMVFELLQLEVLRRSKRIEKQGN